ncbi:hypothetical protein B8W90_13655, partial [Staphylococcus hominis]
TCGGHRVVAGIIAAQEAVKALVGAQTHQRDRCIDALQRGSDLVGLAGLDLEDGQDGPQFNGFDAVDLPLAVEQT